LNLRDPEQRREWQIRSLAFWILANLGVALAYLFTSGSNCHGVVAGIAQYQVELVFDHDAIFIGAIEEPHNVTGVGYVFGQAGLSYWKYLTNVGGASSHLDLAGFRLSTASFFLFAIQVPWWFVIALLLPISGALAALACLKRPVDDFPTCECGYDLRATPDRCPECGKQVTSTAVKPRILDGQIGLWCALVAASVTVADIAIGGRSVVPDWAQLIWVGASLGSAAMLLSDRLLRRASTWQTRFGSLLLAIAAFRIFIPKLN
jgi:hypothetical protein